jgi:uncharacterized protein (DUF58 family)
MRPGRLLVRATAAVAGTGLLVPLVPELAWVVLAAAALVAACACAEALSLRRLELHVERDPSRALSLGEGETVSLAVRSNAGRPVSLELRQVWPALVAEGTTRTSGLLRPGEVLRFAVELHGTSRGRAAVPAAAFAATHVGLVERVLAAGQGSEITVVPDLRAVARLRGRLDRFALRGAGARMSARLGKGRDFDRLREYVLGDEYRDVAWKASARHGKLIVREYRLDRSQHVLLCLDCGHRMAARASGLSRLDHAVNGAVLLSYLCQRLEDRVGILSFAAAVEAGPRPGRGTAQLRLITSFAAGATARYVHSDYPGLAAELRRALRQRTLVVLFTALSELDPQPLLRAVRALSPPHLVLVAVVQDPDLDAAVRVRPADKSELCRALVARDLWNVRERTIRDLRRLGALVVESTPQDVGLAAMNAYIDVKRRQLL